jgi:hypothetical protein
MARYTAEANMIKIQNRYVTKLALLFLGSFSYLQFARGDIDLGCRAGNESAAAQVTYNTGQGVTIVQANPGASYSYAPDANPGHQFFTITTSGPNGNTATTTIDSARGVMRGRSEAHFSVDPGTNDQSTDDITFRNTGSQGVPITIHWRVDGTLSVADTAGHTGNRANYIGVLQFYSGAAGGSVVQTATLSTDPSQNSDSYTPDGWDDPGESIQVQRNPSGLYGYSVTATVVLPPGNTTWHLYTRLGTGVNASGSVDGMGISDFSNTSALSFDLPAGVSFTSPSGTLSSGSRLLNISTRAKVLGSDSVAIAGFIVTGNVPKKVIIRGIGPSLSGFFGAANVLADPTLELKQGNTTLTTNDNWKDTQPTEIQNSGLAPTNNAESAIVRTLNPGNYTAILRGKNDGTGIGVVEVYDLDAPADAKLANISTRAFVEANDNVLIGGIIGGGNGSQPNVVIRAIGPSLTGFGVPNALQDPLLELHDKDGNLIATNDDWQSDQKDAIQAIGLAPTNPKESAILATLLPTNYTAIVKGVNKTTGVALIEVYHIK